MIGVVHRTLSVGTAEFFVIGAVPSGMVLRGVSVIFGLQSQGFIDFACVVSQSREAGLVAINSGQSLIIVGEGFIAGVTAQVGRFQQAAAISTRLELPVYYPVREGPVFVIAAVLSSAAGAVGNHWFGLRVEAERQIMDSRPAARRVGTNGEVLSMLRSEAELARAL